MFLEAGKTVTPVGSDGKVTGTPDKRLPSVSRTVTVSSFGTFTTVCKGEGDAVERVGLTPVTLSEVEKVAELVPLVAVACKVITP